jgi:hypothetical protein
LRSPQLSPVVRHALDPASLAAAGEALGQISAAVGVESSQLLPLAAIGLAGATVAGGKVVGGSKDFPKLFDAWFDGSISRQICASYRAAAKAGISEMEINFPPVPNLEEVQFGTALNMRFQQQIAKELGLADKRTYMSVKRDPVAYANAYWARKLAGACNSGAVIASTADLSKARAAGGRTRETSLGSPGALAPSEALIAVNPIGRWPSIDRAHDGPRVMLNTGFSEGYDLAGPIKSYEQVYYLKRISKGWIYRAYPGKWQGYVEKPDGSVQLLEEYDERPLLREVAEKVRSYSFGKYGVFNDRYAKGFGGRL